MYYSIPVSSVHGFSLELATAHCEQQEVRRDLAMRLRSYVHRGWAQTATDKCCDGTVRCAELRVQP